ncbi:MAG: molybdopterin dehydrogenase [Candidatus Wallbacteria bacterium HGW-Wallbacteria-1]|jgi:carbon-monoxide dehydrogenase medium subunit|uniref:Molybdopterin dehydrogenase n=1 Tax=Candidatus Wallbacteria bacterium HGW-Wallbacteria-1 TaxID=2013854 RepID=A0A2N1PPT1_9BACT|nr:MAG: molybdopterin dehydrogenase [Candidatus Wallbacteria bacterium HGW-Wallbacteria-1]
MLRTFRYEAPENLRDILEIIGEADKNLALLAGGTDILVEIRSKIRCPELLVDIKRASELNRLDFDEKEGLVIGAAVTMGELIRNSMINEKYPFLRDGALQVASHQLRNRATVVGNICTASPCTDMGRVLLSVDADVQISSSSGSREVKMADFFLGVKRTCLKKNEIVTGIHVPAHMAGIRSGHEKLKRLKGHDIAIASVSMACTDESIRVVVGSCSMTPVLIGPFPLNASVQEVKSAVESAIKPIDDVRATAAYRRFMVGTFVIRLMERLGMGKAA